MFTPPDTYILTEKILVMDLTANSEQMFSFYKPPINNITPYRDVTLAQIYELLTGHWLEKSTMELRSINTPADNRQYKSRRFPFATFSGIFLQRKEESLLSHSGLLVLDFDNVPEPEKMKIRLLKDPFLETELLFISPNGNGLKWVVSINPTDEFSHGNWFDAIRNYILETYKIEVDKSGRDVARVCFICHDFEAYLNPRHGRMIMHWPGEIYLTHRKRFNPGNWLNHKKPAPAQNPMPPNMTKQQYHVEVILRRIENSQIDLTCSYADWLKLGFAFAAEYGEAGRGYFHRISRFYPGYDPGKCDEQFSRCLKHCRPGSSGIKTFFAAARDAGINIRV